MCLWTRVSRASSDHMTCIHSHTVQSFFSDKQVVFYSAEAPPTSVQLVKSRCFGFFGLWTSAEQTYTSTFICSTSYKVRTFCRCKPCSDRFRCSLKSLFMWQRVSFFRRFPSYLHILAHYSTASTSILLQTTNAAIRKIVDREITTKRLRKTSLVSRQCPSIGFRDMQRSPPTLENTFTENILEKNIWGYLCWMYTTVQTHLSINM